MSHDNYFTLYTLNTCVYNYNRGPMLFTYAQLNLLTMTISEMLMHAFEIQTLTRMYEPLTK